MRKDQAYSFLRRRKGENNKVILQTVNTSKVDSSNRSYSLLTNIKVANNTNKMVKKSKLANKEIKKGNFGKAELEKRKSDKYKIRAMEAAKFSKEKLLDIHLKSNDGDNIRHENKVRSIEKLN